MGLIQVIHPSLEELDYTLPSVQASVIGGSILFFMLLQFLTRVLFRGTDVYRRLHSGDKVGWNRSILGIIFGTGSTAVGIWTILWDDSIHRDIAMAATPTARFAVLSSAGFSMFEFAQFIVMSITRRQFYPIVFVHHVSLTAILLMVSWCDRMHYITAAGLAMEIILPCDRVSWLLLKAGMRNTWIWEWNQLILIHAFSIRNIVECYMWFLTYKNWHVIWRATPPSLLCLIYGGLVLTTFWMTPFWWIESIGRFSVTFTSRRQMHLRTKHNVISKNNK